MGETFRRGRYTYKVTDVYTDTNTGTRAADFRLLHHGRLHGPTRWADPTEVREWIRATRDSRV
jgi:hypothetical protein